MASYTAPHKSAKNAPKNGKCKTPQNTTEKPLMQDDIRTMILNGTIPSVISDTGATSTAGKGGHPLRLSNHPSDKVFHLPTGGTDRASVKDKLIHKVREPLTEVDIVPGLTNTLLSTGKLVEGGYFAVYDKNEVNIYDGRKAKIIITEEAVLRGYRCSHEALRSEERRGK